MYSVETMGLTRRFGSLVAVDDLTFNVKEGEIFGFLGPNGAGKTTTIRMLACLISASEGSATVCGYDIRKDSLKIRATLGVLTENPNLYERLTAYENMDFFAEAYGLTNTHERRDRIKELLGFFKLWERRGDRVATFSKGMKQKLAVARALVHNPPILFLDEPTSGLDPEVAKEIRDLIEYLSRKENHTVLLSTHRLEDAEKLCSRVMIINKGKSVIIGTPDELSDKIGGPPLLQIVLSNLDRKIIASVKETPQVMEVESDLSRSMMTIRSDDVKTVTPNVVRNIVYAGGSVLSVSLIRPSLEEAYLKLVKEGRE